MKRIHYILLCLCLILVIGCTKENEDKIENPTEDKVEKDTDGEKTQEEIDPIKLDMENMSLEEKVGQLFIVGFEGKEMHKDLEDFIKEYKVSGFILFKRNIGSKDETEKLIKDLKTVNEKNNFPLFISIDEEGGNVSRLNHIFKDIPPAATIGREDNIEGSFNYGNEIGRRLSTLGFNLDFAPILDINTNPKNPVIGSRAFGKTPDVVIKHGIEFMNGIRDNNIIPCVKHFPGHGDTHIDSHIGLPQVDKNLEDLKNMELLPFIKAIEEDVDMIMVAHILFPKIGGNYPASMSKYIISDLLRDDLNYKGVIITDDLTMGGITSNYKIEDGALEFFKAGGDIALIAHKEENYIKSMKKLKMAIDNGEINIKDIDEKVYRVLSLKEKYSL